MNSSRLLSFSRQLVLKGFPQAGIDVSHRYYSRGVCNLVNNAISLQITCQSNATNQINVLQRRFKKTLRNQNDKQNNDNEEEDDDDDDELANENPLLVDDILGASSDGSEQLTLDVGSLRLDSFAKTAFVMQRSKIEEAFYKGDLYVNGEKALKKSLDLSIDDEIDLVKGINVEDRNKLDIKRVQIVKLPDKTNDQGRMKVGVRRWMNLTIDSYDSQNE